MLNYVDHRKFGALHVLGLQPPMIGEQLTKAANVEASWVDLTPVVVVLSMLDSWDLHMSLEDKCQYDTDMYSII